MTYNDYFYLSKSTRIFLYGGIRHHGAVKRGLVINGVGPSCSTSRMICNNSDFRWQILLDKIKLEAIVTMRSNNMISNHRKKKTEDIKVKAMFECERVVHAMASTNQFKCHKCLQWKTTYFRMQTRSVDEPMTTFVTCMNCN